MTSERSKAKGTTIIKPPGAKTEKLVFWGCAFIIVIHLIASFFPHLRLWGINQLHYFSPEFRLALCAIGLFILIPTVNRGLAKLLIRTSAWLGERFKRWNIYFKHSLISLLSLVVFWFLKAQTPLLGDGYLRAGEIRIGKLISAAEPLDSLLHLLVLKSLGLDAYTSYSILSCLAGGLFVFLILLLCDYLGRDGREKLFIFLIVTTMGANQLFFGYIESYTLMYTAMAGYVLFAVRYLQKRGGFLLPCFFMVLAASFHLSAIFVLPSLFYLAFAEVPRRAGEKVGKSRLANAVILAGVTVLMGLGFYVVRADSPGSSVAHLLVYPFGGEDSSYSLFSPEHLLDFFNHQLLTSPVNVVLWIMLVILYSKSIRFKDHVVRFLIGLSICSIAFSLFIHPNLGYARDWDLFAFTGLGTTLLALYLTISALRDLHLKGKLGKGKKMDLGRMTVILLVTSLVSTLPWILVNASEAKSVMRFKHLLAIEGKGADRGYDIMATYFRDEERYGEAIELWEKAITVNPNPRYFASMGNAFRRLGEYHKAIDAYDRSIRMAPDHPTIRLLHESLGICLAEVGRFEEGADELKKAIDLKPGEASHYYTLSDILGRWGKYEEALSYFEKGLNLDPTGASAYRTIGMAYLEIGKKEEARRCLEAYLKTNPKDAKYVKSVIDSIEMEINRK